MAVPDGAWLITYFAATYIVFLILFATVFNIGNADIELSEMEPLIERLSVEDFSEDQYIEEEYASDDEDYVPWDGTEYRASRRSENEGYELPLAMQATSGRML